MDLIHPMDINQKSLEDMASSSITERQQFEQLHGKFDKNDTAIQQQFEQQHSQFDENHKIEIQKDKEEGREPIEMLEGGNQSSVPASTSLHEQISSSWDSFHTAREVFEGDDVSYDLISTSLHEHVSGNEDPFHQLETKLDGAQTFIDIHLKGEDSQIAKVRKISDGLCSMILEAWSGLTSLQNDLRLQREEFQKKGRILQENLEETKIELDDEECLSKDVNGSKNLLQVVKDLYFLEEQLAKKNIMLTQLSEAQEQLCIVLHEKEQQLLISKESTINAYKDAQLLQEESHQIHEDLQDLIPEITSTANDLQQWCASANQQMVRRDLELGHLQSDLAQASSTLMNLKFTRDQSDPTLDFTSAVVQSKISLKILDGDSRENQLEVTECHLLHTEKIDDSCIGIERNLVSEDEHGKQQYIRDVVECTVPCEEMPPTTLRSQIRETLQVLKPEVSTSSEKKVSIQLVSGASDEQCRSAFKEIGLETADSTMSLDQQEYDIHEEDQTDAQGLNIGSSNPRLRSSKDHIRDYKQIKPMACIEVSCGSLEEEKANDVTDDKADVDGSFKRKELIAEEGYAKQPLLRDAIKRSVRSKEKPPIVSELQILSVCQVSVPDASYIPKQTETSASGEPKKIDNRDDILNLIDAILPKQKDYSVIEGNEFAPPKINLGSRNSSLASSKYETADSAKQQKVVAVAATCSESVNIVSSMLDSPPRVEPTMSSHREVKSSDVDEAETRKENELVFTRNAEDKVKNSKPAERSDIDITEVSSLFHPVWTKMDEESLVFKEDLTLKGKVKKGLEKNSKESYIAIHQLASQPELMQRFEDKTNHDDEPFECLIEGDDDMLPLQMFEKARCFLKQKKKLLNDLRQAIQKVKSRESACFGLESTLLRVQNLLSDVQNAFEDNESMNSKSSLQLQQAYKEIIAAQEFLVWMKRAECEDQVCRAEQDAGHENQSPACTQTNQFQDVLSDMLYNQHYSPDCINKKLACERDADLTWLAYRWDRTEQNDQSIQETLNYSKERQLKLLRINFDLQREQNIKLKQQVAQICVEADKGKRLLHLEKLELEKLRRETHLLSKRMSKEAHDLSDSHSIAIKAKDLIIETLKCELKALLTRYEMKDEINRVGPETQKIRSLEERLQSQFQMLCTMQERMADLLTQTKSQVRELKKATNTRDAVSVELRAFQIELKLALQRLKKMAAEKQMLILNLEKKENDLMQLQEQNVSLVCEKMVVEDSAEALQEKLHRLMRKLMATKQLQLKSYVLYLES